MENKGLLTVIAIVLIGILALLVMQANKETPSEQLVNSIGEVTEEIGDEIDDATTAN